MKKSTLIIIATGIAACSIVSCKSKPKNTQADAQKQTTSITEKALKVNDLLAVADQRVNDTIVFQGPVKHTCSHSGRRCFISDPTDETTIRVEVGGNIKSFNRELVNSEIAVTGVLKEQRFSKEYIDKWEKELKEEEAKGEKDEAHCDSEKNSILKMRNWMKKNNKDAYVIYYVEGIDYDIVK